MDNNAKITLFWFRRDLRLSDNVGLFNALKTNHKVLPIFIFDTNILDKLSDKTDARVSFIYENLVRMKKELQGLGSDLLVFYGKPLEVFENISELFDISSIYCNRDYEPYAISRDKAIYQWAINKGIAMKGFKDHVIFDKNEVVKPDSKPYTVFTPYKNKWLSTITEEQLTLFDTTAYQKNYLQIVANPILELSEMGFHKSKIIVSEPAQITLKFIEKYAKERDLPANNATSRLSVHLRFGTVSVRHYAKVAQQGNPTWLNELIWRDFYHMILYHFPHSATNAFKPAYDQIPWRNNEQEFKKWCSGHTGYLLVDAGMRELNETGFMHNRVRMVVASFLTKHLFIDWRWGEAYFAEKLLDFDLAANVGGWQWAAGSGCDAAPYFRVFNPLLQLQKFDPLTNYVKHWIPEYNTNNYPPPIVQHEFARKRAIETYKAALQGH